MKIIISKRQPCQVPIGAIFMVPLFAIPFIAWLITQDQYVPGGCGIKALLSVPCISCGGTRATFLLLEGRVLDAIIMQPMIMLVYLGLFLWGTVSFISFVRNTHIAIDLGMRGDRIFKASLVAIPLFNWLYLMWQGV